MRSLLALALLSAGAAAQYSNNLWIVDQQGTGDFTTIQAAVAAAESGDRILVHSGAYDGFQIDGMTLAVEAVAHVCHRQPPDELAALRTHCQAALELQPEDLDPIIEAAGAASVSLAESITGSAET